MTPSEQFRAEFDEVKQAHLVLAQTVEGLAAVVADVAATATDGSRVLAQLAETVERLSRGAERQAEVLARLAGQAN